MQSCAAGHKPGAQGTRAGARAGWAPGARQPHLSPARLNRRPPSPRTASEMRKARPGAGGAPGGPGGRKAVGWNCTNSMLATAAWARKAMAMPSPVATAGLVVSGYACPPVRARSQLGPSATGSLATRA